MSRSSCYLQFSIGLIPSLINILANPPMVIIGLWVYDGVFKIHNVRSKSKRFCIHLYVLLDAIRCVAGICNWCIVCGL